jgi:hypothetical protein
MLLKKIESLRKQPKHIRNRYAFGTAATVTLIIALVWSVSLPGRFYGQSTTNNTDSDGSEKISETFSNLSNTISESMGDIKMQAELFDIESSSTLETEEVAGEVTATEASSRTTGTSTAVKNEGNIIRIEARSSASSSTSTATE